MTRCDHHVDKSLSVGTSITTHVLQHCARLEWDRSCAQLEGIPRAGFVSGTWLAKSHGMAKSPTYLGSARSRMRSSSTTAN
jgi:hypothetical protein